MEAKKNKCGECGQEVEPNQFHNFECCLSFKAGIQEVVEWGNEPCPHIQELLKRDCDMCRQVKLKVWGITASE